MSSKTRSSWVGGPGVRIGSKITVVESDTKLYHCRLRCHLDPSGFTASALGYLRVSTHTLGVAEPDGPGQLPSQQRGWHCARLCLLGALPRLFHRCRSGLLDGRLLTLVLQKDGSLVLLVTLRAFPIVCYGDQESQPLCSTSEGNSYKKPIVINKFKENSGPETTYVQKRATSINSNLK